MRYSRMLTGVAVSCLLGGEAMAGVVITLETGSAGGQPAASTMSLESDRLRMSSAHNDMIYRADLGKVWIMDTGDRSYREMTPESMKQMRAQMAGAMAQMQQNLQSMPPEQRKRIEAMMAQRGMGPQAGTPEQAVYEKDGDPKMVGQWSCTPYKVSVNGAERSQMCIAKLADVGLTRDDLKAFASLGVFMQSMMAGPGGEHRRPAGVYDFDAMSKSIGFDGIPVQTAHVSTDGKTEIESTIKSVDRKSIPADAFELPAGYTKQEMPMMGAGKMPGSGRPPAE